MMEVSNETILNIERTLGSIDSKLYSLEKHQDKMNAIQEANNKKIWQKLDDHEVRIRKNEIQHAKRTVVISGATAVGMALIIEVVKAGAKAVGS